MFQPQLVRFTPGGVAAAALCALLAPLWTPPPCSQPTLPGQAISEYAVATDPRQLTFAADGTLYIARDNSGTSGGTNVDPVRLQRVAPGGGAAAEFGPLVSDPDGVAIAPGSAALWNAGAVLVGGQKDLLANPIEGEVLALDPLSGAASVVLGESSSWSDPHHFVFDSSGRLLFVDRIGRRVVAVTPAGVASTLIAGIGATRPTSRSARRIASTSATAPGSSLSTTRREPGCATCSPWAPQRRRPRSL